MGHITLKNYNNITEYARNSHSSISDLCINTIDLISYAISSGGFSNRTVTPAGTLFYTSLIQMALIDGACFTINDDYRYSEPSIKNSISFFMGMVAAQAIAANKYHIAYLFHLKDPQIEFITTGMTPDFFGLANGTVPTLLEAKGTASPRPSYKTIETAKDQLSNICEVEVLGWNTYHNFQRHVIASGFDNNTLTYYDIDPEAEGDKKISFNLDKAIISYYRPISSLLSYGRLQSMTYSNRKYTFVDLGDIKIGLSDTVYSYIKRFYVSGNMNPDRNFMHEKKTNVYKEIMSMSDELTVSESNKEIALHQDGIICFL